MKLCETILSCLTKETWDRPTAEQLVEIAEENLKCSPQSDIKAENTQIDAQPSISGWTAIFLWVGIGGGLLATSITLLSSVFSKSTDSFTRWFNLIYLTLFALIGIKTIISFYKRRENAVALATTYCTMVALDAAMVFALFCLNLSDTCSLGVCNLLWAGIWLTFVYCSEDIKEICPEKSRKWRRLEIFVLSFFSLLSIVMIILCWYGAKPVYVENVNSKDTPSASVVSSEKQDSIGIAVTVTSQLNETVKATQPSVTPVKPSTSVKDNSPEAKNDNASKLKDALQMGDYSTVKRLAEGGYIPAYLPLANHYLNDPATHAQADRYARKAINAGHGEAQSVIDALENLGFYD